jgi:hypothetical protein
MSIELKFERTTENTVTVSVNSDIDMSSSTKVRDFRSPLFQGNNKATIHRSELKIYKTLSELKTEKLKKLEGKSSFGQTH